MLQALLRQRVPQDRIAASDLLQTLAHLAHALKREVGVYVDRHGRVREVMVSRRWQDLLPALAARASPSRLVGLRYIAARPEAERAPGERDGRHVVEARLDLAVVVGSRKGRPGEGWLVMMVPAADGAGPQTATEGPYGPEALAHLEVAPRIKAAEGALRRSSTVVTAETRPERAILVGLSLSPAPSSDRVPDPPAGAEVCARVVQARFRPDAATFIGRGKVGELLRLCEEHDADLVIFDEELSPAQQRNLERVLGRKVVDRTALVLDIFARRAQTREGRLQVELAQLTYLLPRLTGRGVWLSRLGGGIGTRGPGETKLEVDRRRIRQRITDLRRELRVVARHRTRQRDSRRRAGYPVVAITGYTNAGKSTLLNALTRAGVLVEDRLFATLDPTVRRVTLPNHQTVLLVDTVGFIHKLPTHLVAAFRATLEEAVDADLLVHVVDVTDPQWPHQMAVVDRVLADLGAGDRPQVVAFNKIDRLPAAACRALARAHPHAVLISAQYGLGLVNLLRRIAQRLPQRLVRLRVAVPYAQAGTLAQIYAHGRVLEQRYAEDGVVVEAEVPPALAARLRGTPQ